MLAGSLVDAATEALEVLAVQAQELTAFEEYVRRLVDRGEAKQLIAKLLT